MRTFGKLQRLLLEAVPENTGGILDNANICCDDGLIILHQWNTLAFPCLVEKGSDIVKSGEPPISLVSGKSVGCNWNILA